MDVNTSPDITSCLPAATSTVLLKYMLMLMLAVIMADVWKDHEVKIKEIIHLLKQRFYFLLFLLQNLFTAFLQRFYFTF